MYKTLTPEQIAEGWQLHDGNIMGPFQFPETEKPIEFMRKDGDTIKIGKSFSDDICPDWKKVVAYRTFSPDAPSLLSR